MFRGLSLFIFILFCNCLQAQIDSLLQVYESFDVFELKEKRLETLDEINEYYYTNEDWQGLIYNSKKILSVADGDTSEVTGDAYYKMATAYYYLNIDNKIEESTRNAYEHYKEVNHKDGLFRSLVGLGISQELKENNIAALEYYREAEDIKNLSLSQQSELFSNIATAYFRLKKMDQSLHYMFKSLDIDKSIEPIDSNMVSLGYSNIGNAYKQSGQLEKSFIYLDSALVYAKSEHRLSSIFETLSTIHAQNGTIDMATHYFQEYMKIERKILEMDLMRDVYDAEKSFTLENKLIKTEADHSNRIKSFRTTFFFVILVALIIISIGFLILINNRKKLYKTDLEKVLLEQQLLRTQMNPHFTFNTLSNIHSLIAVKDTEKAGSMLKRFSSLMRVMLENASDPWVSLSSEIQAVKDYVHIQEYRFKREIALSIDSGSIDQDIHIPPMLIQPFVENSIEHGLRDIPNPKIDIKITERGDALLVAISDNGIGINNAQKKQKGKKSMSIDINRKRLQILSNQLHVDTFIKFENNNPGTIVHISLPYKP